MDLEGTILRQRQVPYVLTYRWNLKNKEKKEKHTKKQNQAQRLGLPDMVGAR